MRRLNGIARNCCFQKKLPTITMANPDNVPELHVLQQPSTVLFQFVTTECTRLIQPSRVLFGRGLDASSFVECLWDGFEVRCAATLAFFPQGAGSSSTWC